MDGMIGSANSQEFDADICRSITRFTKPKAIVTLVVALIFLIDANLIMPLFGVELDDGGVMVGRILGGAYLGAGIGFWMISGPEDIPALTARLYALSEVLVAVACLVATVTGVMNAVGWLLVVAYAFFAGGFFRVASRVNTTN